MAGTPHHMTDAVRSVDLHLVERGRGPRLVLIHGVAGSRMVWDAIAPELEPQFTLTMVDLLGYGRSPKPRMTYTPELHVEVLRGTLQRHRIEPPYVLVGLSMGANLMLEYARRWPGEASELVGIGFPYYSSEAEARSALRHNPWIRLTLDHPALAAVATPLAWAIGRHTAWAFGSRSTLYSPAVAADALRARYLAFTSSVLNCMVQLRQDDLLEASGELRRLFIHGKDDTWAAPAALESPLAKYPRTTFKVIDGPHNLVVAQPKRTAALIVGHLASAASGGPAAE